MRMSLLFGCVAAALCLGTAPAMSADMLPPEPPLYEPPPPPAFEVTERSCMYVRVDGGYTFNEEPDVTKNHGIAFGENSDEGWFAEAGVGCRVTPYFRTEVTVGYRGGIHLDTDFNDLDADFSAVTGMLNGYWDITNFNGITPYVGAGIGVSMNMLSDVNLPVNQSANEKFDFAWALMAGVSYDVSERVTLDLAYRYIDLGNAIADGPDPIKYSNAKFHDIKVGLRYNFE